MSDPIEGPRSGFCYVAAPFSHWNPAIKLERRLLVAQFVYYLVVEKTRPAFAPITYGWSLASEFRLPDDAEFWAPLNLAMLNAASSMAVLCLPGWEESKGVAQELRFAADLGLPVEYWTRNPDGTFSLLPESLMEAAE